MSTRIAFMTMILTTLFLFVWYEASLTGALAVHNTVLPFEDTEGLYTKSDFKVATVAGASVMELMKKGNAIEQKIYQDRLMTVADPEEGLRRSLGEKVAFLWDQEVVESVVGQDGTHAKVEKCFYSAPVAWAVRKDFQYKDFMSY